MIIKILAATIFVIMCPLSAISQDIVTESLLENVHKWCEGNVTLTDGKEISGLVRFDDNSGVVTFQNGELSKALIAKNCAKFSFYDEEAGKQRFFYSLEYDDGQTFKKFYFFELLRSFDQFAVLSKVDPISVENRTQRTGGFMSPDGSIYDPGTTYSRTEIHQTETIYLANERGGIKPYVQILERDIDSLFGKRTRSKNKFIDKDLLQSYTGRHYKKLEEFAERNGLSFKVKSELLRIMDAYADLVQE